MVNTQVFVYMWNRQHGYKHKPVCVVNHIPILSKQGTCLWKCKK